jgi:hypothetical protein
MGRCIPRGGKGPSRQRRQAALQAAADFAHAAAELPTQQGPQCHALRIPDFGGDLVDTGVADPEKVHRALYPQVLEEGERRLAQHCIRRAKVRLLVASAFAAWSSEKPSARRPCAQRSNCCISGPAWARWFGIE